MLEFIRKEKSRSDFGKLFDDLLDRFWGRKFFRDCDDIENCLNIIQDYIKKDQKVLASDADLIVLFHDSKFIESSHCKELLTTLVKGLHVVPTYNIEWRKENRIVGDNFIWTDIYETEKVPYYYILNCNNSDWTYLLVNKDTGKLLELYITELFPSSSLDIVNGRFMHDKLDSVVPYQLQFGLNDEKNEIISIDFTHTPLESMVTIPDELAEFVHTIMVGSITPSGTNVDHRTEVLSDEEDIKFRNRVLELLKNELEKKEDFELPF